MATSLRHRSHEHPLILRELSENCKFCRCYLCNIIFHGKTYCCLECDFFLHELCALIPLPSQIQHPIDPKHPLTFSKRQYCCGDCNIQQPALRLIATLPPERQQEDEGGETIRHFAHKHPLSSFHVAKTNGVNCKLCTRQVYGGVFGCRACCFLVHESCARLPRQIPKHLFHPQHNLILISGLVTDYEKRFQCKACGVKHSVAYFCDECEVSLDVLCAASTLVLANEEKKDGEHQISCICMRSESNILCQLCRVKISSEEVYCCFDCIFFVHKSCVEELPQEIQHYLHNEHPLIHRARPWPNGQEFHCRICSGGCCGITFNCESCDFDLHLECAIKNLSAAREGEDGAVSSIRHFSHDHPLGLLYYVNKVRFGPKCHACKQPADGLIYSCEVCKDFLLHKSCAELPSQLAHVFHPQHPLVLVPKESNRYLYCSICHKKSEGFTYHCAECHFYLDTECALKKATVKHGRHEHALVYFERSTTERLRCNSCGKSCHVDLYRCLLCNFNIHFDCLPLPHSIRHEWHRYHPLVLWDKFIDGMPDDLYCDLCEEIRNPDHGVYRCEECYITVHIECVIPTVKLEAEGTKPTENRPELDELDSEIVSLKESIEVMERNLKETLENLDELRLKRQVELSKA